MSVFEGFREVRVTVTGADQNGDRVEIYARVGGSGPGLLLLHGYPQTHRMWRHVACSLAERYTVVCADLRGYGQSSKPRGSESHVEYSKRAMAKDMIDLMQSPELGLDVGCDQKSRFSIVAHDRGARVAHRLALDHPDILNRMVLLDIAPTLWMYEHTDMAFAMGYWHWFFLPQPSPQTEDFILAEPQRYWAMLGLRGSHQGVRWTDDDVKAYQTPYLTPEGVHAACEDYRAAATIDLEHDRADLAAGRKLSIPALKVIWGGKGMIEALHRRDLEENEEGGIRAIWQGYCDDSVGISAHSLDCGHYVAEEKPRELLEILKEYI